MTLCGDNWLYEEASLKISGSSLLNFSEKTMMYVNVYATSKSSLNVKKGYFRSTDMF